MFRRWDAYPTFLLLRGLTSFAFTMVFATGMIYQANMVGLNPFQLVIIGTTLEVTLFLFEIPTGVVADLFSRRLSLLIGYFLIGIGFLVEAIPTFEAIFLAQLVWGLGYTFTSGAGDAWIVDEIGQERATKAFLRASQVGQIASFIAIPLSALIATQSLNAPHFVAAGGFLLTTLIMLVIMPEKGFRPTPPEERETWHDFFKVFREGASLIRVRPILLSIVLVSLGIGLFSEGWDRLWTAHLMQTITIPAFGGLDPLIWFGAISMIESLLGFFGTELLQRRNIQSHRALAGALAGAHLLIGVGIFAFAWAGNFWMAILALWMVSIARTLSDPLYSAWINQHTTSNVRATVLSIASQANAIGQIGGGPIVGYIGLLSGVRVAMSISGALILPTVALIFRTGRLKEPVAETA